jgi:hypothetical protein
MAIAFYCLGTLDVTGIAERQISPTSRKSWKEWIWDQYAGKEHIVFFLFYCAHFLLTWCFGCAITEGGFHPGPFVSVSGGDTTAHVRPIPSLLHLPLCARLRTSVSTSQTTMMTISIFLSPFSNLYGHLDAFSNDPNLPS